MGSKPALGVIAVAKKNHQKDEIYQLVDYYQTRLGQEPSANLMLEPKVIFDEHKLVQRARQMEVDGADPWHPFRL